jgi:translation initiation factor IF-1
MSGEKAFQVEGIVTGAQPNGTYQVKLRNGHQLTAFVTGRARRSLVRFAPGDSVRLQLSPYDLSEGRIIVETETK